MKVRTKSVIFMHFHESKMGKSNSPFCLPFGWFTAPRASLCNKGLRQRTSAQVSKIPTRCKIAVKNGSMKNFRLGAFILFSMILAGRAIGQSPLTTLQAIHALSQAEADKGLIVTAEATVIFYRASQKTLILQNGNVGIYAKCSPKDVLVPGDRVLVKGVTIGGSHPYILCDSVTFLKHGTLPKPAQVTFNDLIQGKDDATLITTRGEVRAANPDAPSADHISSATLRILIDGGAVDAEVQNSDAQTLSNLLDAEVQVTAAAGAKFDGKRQKTGILLHVSNLSDFKILKPAPSDPWSLPLTPMDEIFGAYHLKDSTSRVRVSGVVTYFEPGAALTLQDGTKSLWVWTRSFAPVRVGDRAEVTGFPNFNSGFLGLAPSDIRDTGIAVPISPLTVTWQQLATGQHNFDLVSIEGVVAVATREAALDEYVLISNGYEFPAVYRHPAISSPASLPPIKSVVPGSRVRVTGICTTDYASRFSQDNAHFQIMLRSPDDIAVLAEPSWFDTRHFQMLAGLLLIATLLFGARGWYLERRNRRQIGSLAYVEKRRGRILEEINGSQPLAEILERTTELVSVRLNGAPCWCHIADGATLGNCPKRLDSKTLRVIERPIAARNGPPLGKIFAAFDTRTKPGPDEVDALAMAAELATLAIETSRLYSDLVRRSEFDLLTDVQNRFAMERTLENLIHDARQTAGIFGLVYIDLNEFKQVNDVHGHLVGDLYLQEVAQRMKKQLRPGDMLARLGGDEFAALVPSVRSRAEVEEIAERLGCCFDEPFAGEGYVLRGSASIGIALYPEDAISADSLLNKADAAMYVAKYSRPGRERSRMSKPDSELVSEDSQ